MLLRDQVNADISAAMKAKDAARLSALRMLKAAIMNKGVEKGHDLDDAEVLQVVSTLVKQRRDSIEQFSNAGRIDLVDKETAEITVLEHYLPPAASAVEIDAAVARGDRRDRRKLAEGHGQGDESGDAAPGGQECGWPRRERGGPPQAWSLALLLLHNTRSRAPPRRREPPR